MALLTKTKDTGRALTLKMRGYHSAQNLIRSKGLFYTLDRLKVEKALMEESYINGFVLAIKNSRLA